MKKEKKKPEEDTEIVEDKIEVISEDKHEEISEDKSIAEDESSEKPFDEKAFLRKVEKAAARGARKGGFSKVLLSLLPAIVLIGLFAYFVLPQIQSFNRGFESLLHVDDPAESHDLVLDDDGILGYTAADFEDAILGDQEKLKKLEVMRQEVSDVSTVTETGLFNWSALTKTKLITYNGTAIYTVDLSGLRKTDISFDEENKIITLRIPHAVLEPINIPEDRIQFGDTTGGLLAFGELKLTPEQAATIQAGARQKMEEKLAADNVQATADRFAILCVWELYSPIVKGVARDYSLEVIFR